jgi:hypothetical protein
MRKLTFVVLAAAVGLAGPMLPSQTAAKNKAQIVAERVAVCRTERSEDYHNCHQEEANGFSQTSVDRCFSAADKMFKICEIEAHRSVFVTPPPTGVTPPVAVGGAIQQ